MKNYHVGSIIEEHHVTLVRREMGKYPLIKNTTGSSLNIGVSYASEGSSHKVKGQAFQWTPECQSVFLTANLALVNVILLHHPHLNAKTRITVTRQSVVC